MKRTKWLSLLLSLSFGLMLFGCATTCPTATDYQQQVSTLQTENAKLKQDIKESESDLTDCMGLVKEAIPEVNQ